MRRLNALFACLICVWALLPMRPATSYADEPQQPLRQATADDYVRQEIQGWTIMVHPDLLANEDLARQVLAEADHQLFGIKRVVPAERVKQLQETTIWLELNNPKVVGACYHPSRGWLKDNGFIVEKARGIEVGNARNFLDWCRRAQPYMLLHELAHAYHHQHLGHDEPRVIAAYQSAKESGTYESVLHINGRTQRHYAMNNEKEYFSELTECYFGTNDFYPFVRSELKEHDPEGFAMMHAAWGPRQ